LIMARMLADENGIETLHYQCHEEHCHT
jgi:hypothetical protein